VCIGIVLLQHDMDTGKNTELRLFTAPLLASSESLERGVVEMGRTAGMALVVHGAEDPVLGPLLIQLHFSTTGFLHFSVQKLLKPSD
jgi:hypothetical protein